MNSTQCTQKIIMPKSFKVLFAIFWTQYTILPFALQLYRKLPVIGFTYQYIKPSFICFILFLSANYIAKKIKIKDFIFYLICVFVVCLHGILYTNNAEEIYDVVLSFLGIVMPIYFVGLAYSHDDLKDTLYWSSLIGCLCVISYQFYQLGIGRELPEDNMGTAYNILPSILVLINHAFETRKWHDTLLSMLALFSIFLFGTRGPILSCLVFVAVRMIFLTFNNRSWKNVSFLTVILLFLIFLSLGEQMIDIAQYLSLRFSRMGLSTRIFDMFIEGEISDDSNRNILYSKIIEAIQENSILGVGFMGDRKIIGGTYAHNVFLEIWCHFGVILGTLIIALYLFIPIVALAKCRNDSCFGFVLALVIMMFVKLAITGSYVYEKYLFFMLGLCVNSIRNIE